MNTAQLHQDYLNGDQIYTCSSCHTHLARNVDIISKNFRGRHGPAYLFNKVHNITLGTSEERTLMTGLHSVADITCNTCQNVVGWIYLHAFEESQKYKEGKYVVEAAMISKENLWMQRE
ncbi:yippee zinc-binding/DNA-binding /Mis18, centromere assembly-domain-containing protein [Mortierella sp. GBAus27b]|nr:yippee zinc-binding/DNA-binding /Mis18, centromere assembly-domain-containing protein [Mortierella sp. GBAus27b]